MWGGIGSFKNMKPLNKVKVQWSPNFAYALGLLTTDGCLSGDGRHIDFTSQDNEQLQNFMNGTFYSYWDPRWRSSFMFYTCFLSASKKHIDWIREKVFGFVRIKGHISKSKNDPVYRLSYGKKDTLTLVPNLYYSDDVVCLTRKREKIKFALDANKNKEIV